METNNVEQQALLIMDYQVGIADKLPEFNSIVAKSNQAIDAARKSGIKIIFTKVGFEVGFPEVGVNTIPAFQQAKANNLFSGEQSKLVPQLNAAAGDIVINKKRFGAFAGNDLNLILHAHGINNLIMAGVSSSGVVLSTLRLAADTDYRVTILSDCCADKDAEVHKMLVEKIFPMQAKVINCEDWIKSL